jgi:hypothetical protein
VSIRKNARGQLTATTVTLFAAAAAAVDSGEPWQPRRASSYVMRRSLLAVGAASGIGLVAMGAAGAPSPPKERFELSAELEARVTVHQDLVTNAGRSAEDFCKLVADTVQILDPVALELSRFGGSEHSSVPFSEIQRAYLRTERLAPGLSLIVTEEITQTGIDYRWLAKLAPPEARSLLRAMGGFEIGKEGIESWGVRITDSSACQAPERGRAALAALVKSWSSAPGCLKDALRERLSTELERMVGWSRFCGDRGPTQVAVRKSAGLLKGLGDVDGPRLADRWLQTAAATDTRFNCGPG